MICHHVTRNEKKRDALLTPLAHSNSLFPRSWNSLGRTHAIFCPAQQVENKDQLLSNESSFSSTSPTLRGYCPAIPLSSTPCDSIIGSKFRCAGDFHMIPYIRVLELGAGQYCHEEDDFGWHLCEMRKSELFDLVGSILTHNPSYRCPIVAVSYKTTEYSVFFSFNLLFYQYFNLLISPNPTILFPSKYRQNGSQEEAPSQFL